MFYQFRGQQQGCDCY